MLEVPTRLIHLKYISASEKHMQRTFGKVTELVVVFRDCLRALVPHVTKVGIEWEDGKSHDEWDKITQALYSAIVAGAISYTVEGEGFGELMPYGMVMPDYAQKSFLFSAQFGPTAPFLMLEGMEPSFDIAVFLELDSAGKPTDRKLRRSIRELEFVALLRSPDKEREIGQVVLNESWD